MQRTDWKQLSASVRTAIEARTGRVYAASTAPAGKNSAIAALLETDAGQIFVKGLRTEDPRVVAQRREAAVSPYVSPLSPELLWHTEVDGWNLLGFRAAAGRHADYTPGSADLPKVVDLMRRLALLRCPDIPQLKRAESRWADYIDHADLALLRGDNLLHTDYALDNILIDGSHAWLIDWAWPTLGAAFIDPCCLIVRLIFAGHTPAQAESCVAETAAWQDASTHAIDVFASGLATMWTEIADADPTAWKQQMAASVRSWLSHRQDSRPSSYLVHGAQ
jgi:hypothetical protein